MESITSYIQVKILRIALENVLEKINFIKQENINKHCRGIQNKLLTIALNFNPRSQTPKQINIFDIKSQSVPSHVVNIMFRYDLPYVYIQYPLVKQFSMLSSRLAMALLS